MVIEATRNLLNGGARGGDTLVRGAQAQAAQNGSLDGDEDSLFTCPDRDDSGFVPSSR
jgi:hypothetical protein